MLPPGLPLATLGSTPTAAEDGSILLAASVPSDSTLCEPLKPVRVSKTSFDSSEADPFQGMFRLYNGRAMLCKN
ncbi:hypothetical protein M758_UG306700 [Ceratodon purpureus]|nr:hypothetical protein M758_UG306700 [Ceratodon purpureus]